MLRGYKFVRTSACYLLPLSKFLHISLVHWRGLHLGSLVKCHLLIGYCSTAETRAQSCSFTTLDIKCISSALHSIGSRHHFLLSCCSCTTFCFLRLIATAPLLRRDRPLTIHYLLVGGAGCSANLSAHPHQLALLKPHSLSCIILFIKDASQHRFFIVVLFFFLSDPCTGRRRHLEQPDAKSLQVPSQGLQERILISLFAISSCRAQALRRRETLEHAGERRSKTERED